MSSCCICGQKNSVKPFEYDAKLHLDMMLIRMHDRHKVCAKCHTGICGKQLMVLHSQLPLPALKHNAPKGVFATRQYHKGDFVAAYTGTLISSWEELLEAQLAKNQYIIQLFIGNPEKIPAHKLRWVDGTSDARFINNPVPGSFDVNCEFVLENENDPEINLYATRNIQPGMELFVFYGEDDYGTKYFEGVGKKPLNSQDVVEYFAKRFQYGSVLRTNLRFCSVKLPALVSWISLAKELIDTDVKKERSIYNKQYYQKRKAKAAEKEKKEQEQRKGQEHE